MNAAQPQVVMDTAGHVERLWIKRFRRGPMNAVAQAEAQAGRGLAGNADQGGRRQVTIIARGRWDRVNETLADDVDPALRRANVLVTGIDLEGTRGRVLRIGPCRLRIRGETRPCERMDEGWPGLRAALDADWGGGAYAEVLAGGPIAVGDPVAWEPDAND